MDTKKGELTALRRMHGDLGLEASDDPLVTALSSLAVTHSFTANAMKVSLLELDKVTELERIRRRLVRAHLESQRAALDASEATFAQVVRDEYANGSGIEELFQKTKRRALYPVQFAAALKCFRFMRKHRAAYDRLPPLLRMELFIVMNPDFFGRLEPGELYGVDFDRAIAAIVESDCVQVPLYSVGPARAAAAFLERAVGISERTGRRWVAQAKDTAAQKRSTLAKT